jgi:transposase
MDSDVGMTGRGRYSRELRERAVRLASQTRRPMAELATELGVRKETLRGWVRADRAERTLDALRAAQLVRPFRISDYSSTDPDQLAAGETLYAIELADPHGEPPHLYGLEHLWWGDYTGDAVARSNYRCLTQDFPDSFIHLRDSMRHQGLAVLPAALGNQRLASALLGLGEYPLYKEEDLSALEAELAEQAWDAYLAHDVSSYLERDYGIDCEDLEVPDARLRELFYQAHDRHGDVHADNAVDVVFPYLDEAVADVAAALRRDLPAAEPAGQVSRRAVDPAPHHGSAFPCGPAITDAGTGRNLNPPARGPAPGGRAPGR